MANVQKDNFERCYQDRKKCFAYFDNGGYGFCTCLENTKFNNICPFYKPHINGPTPQEVLNAYRITTRRR